MTDQPDHDLLHCRDCGDEIGETTLVYVDGDDDPLCDGCATVADVAGVGYVKQWYDQPMFGDLTRQAIESVKPLPGEEIRADGGQAVADQTTILDKLADHGRCGLSEMRLAAEVGRSYGETVDALDTFEAGGLVEEISDSQWRLTDRGEEHV